MTGTDSNRIACFFNKLGPGLLLAATSIGASHLVMSPKAGAMFGFELLWLVALTHLFKYHAFEFGPRYAAATGESLIAGYMRIPGPRGWALWIFLIGTIAQGIGVLAAVVGIAAAVLYTFVEQMPPWLCSASVITTVLLFLLLGGYGWLDFLNKIMMTVLFIATVAVFVPVFPRASVFVNFVVPSVPAGSLVLIAAILGWMPTGIDVSIWHSLWTLEKHPELTSADSPRGSNRRLEILKFSLTDMRIGYVLSFVIATIFLLLGAICLRQTAGQMDGIGFAKSLGAIYAGQIGPWMYYVFMVAAFTAMYSTTYTVMDGFSRSFAETVTTLFPKIRTRWRPRLYWIFVLCAAAFALLILTTIGKNPVALVLAVALLSFCVAPLYYCLNYYCVTRLIKDPKFTPQTLARAVAVAGVVLMLLAAIICIGAKFGLLK